MNRKIRCQEAKKKTCFVFSDNFNRDCYPRCRRKILQKKSTEEFFKKRLLFALYIPENFYYGNRYYDLDQLGLREILLCNLRLT